MPVHLSLPGLITGVSGKIDSVVLQTSGRKTSIRSRKFTSKYREKPARAGPDRRRVIDIVWGRMTLAQREGMNKRAQRYRTTGYLLMKRRLLEVSRSPGLTSPIILNTSSGYTSPAPITVWQDYGAAMPGALIGFAASGIPAFAAPWIPAYDPTEVCRPPPPPPERPPGAPYAVGWFTWKAQGRPMEWYMAEEVYARDLVTRHWGYRAYKDSFGVWSPASLCCNVKGFATIYTPKDIIEPQVHISFSVQDRVPPPGQGSWIHTGYTAVTISHPEGAHPAPAAGHCIRSFIASIKIDTGPKPV